MQKLSPIDFNGNSLKNIDFILWRVARAKRRQHEQDTHRALLGRPQDHNTRH
ncbi:MAG: hypothetical protein J0L77_09660 [Alphaproteobacteria bacterium]|nr:hypothetical protein [Alphaproteobacteria bacterium]